MRLLKHKEAVNKAHCLYMYQGTMQPWRVENMTATLSIEKRTVQKNYQTYYSTPS